MNTTRRPNGWWIETGWHDCPDCGPYTTKAEAEDDRRGLERAEKGGDRPGYATIEKPKPT